MSLATYDEDRRETRPTWDAGIIHRMNSTTLSVETGRSWNWNSYLAERDGEDRYLATLRTETERTSAGMSIAVREYGLDRKGMMNENTPSRRIFRTFSDDELPSPVWTGTRPVSSFCHVCPRCDAARPKDVRMCGSNITPPTALR